MKTRIITGIIMALAALSAIFLLPSNIFALLLLGVMLLAYREWMHLLNAIIAREQIAKNVSTVVRGTMLVAVTAIAVYSFYAISPVAIPLRLLVLFAALFWLVQLVRLVDQGSFGHFSMNQYRFLGLLLLLSTWVVLFYLHLLSGWHVLAMMAVVWAADSGAYFCGRQWGRRPLAATISPKKTIEGVWGGLAAALVIAMIFAISLFDGDGAAPQRCAWILASLAAAAVSVVGDLFESHIKRRADMKDSGTLLPGHGGILDRIDGQLAAAPVFAVVWWVLGNV